MNSFYGGPNGAPFKISKVFHNVYYDYYVRLYKEDYNINKLNDLIEKQKLYTYDAQNTKYIKVEKNHTVNENETYYEQVNYCEQYKCIGTLTADEYTNWWANNSGSYLYVKNNFGALAQYERVLYDSNNPDANWTSDTIFYELEETKIDLQNDSLMFDLEKRWQSNIGVDEYVMVMYDVPYGELYDQYSKPDYFKVHKNYNGTLWQKIYTEENLDNYKITYNNEVYTNFLFTNDNRKGWGYKFIGSFAGQTPHFTYETQEIEASEKQDIKLTYNSNETAADKPILTFTESKPWVFKDDLKTDLEANQNATLDFYAINERIKAVVEIPENEITEDSKEIEQNSIIDYLNKLFGSNERPFDLQKGDSIKVCKKTLNGDRVEIKYPYWGYYSDFENTAKPEWQLVGNQNDFKHSTKQLEIHMPKAWNFVDDITQDLCANQHSAFQTQKYQYHQHIRCYGKFHVQGFANLHQYH